MVKRWHLASIGALALLTFKTYLFFPHTPDDAFITARYGYNLANGYGPTWNPGGAPVEGYSSFLWMVIHGLLSVFGDQQIIISKFLGGALTISWAYLVVQLGIYVGLKKFTASIAGLLFAAVPPVAFWGVSGMETPMLGIALTAAVLVLVRSEGISGRVLASILFGIAALVRHEAIVLLIGLGAAVFVVELAHTNLRNAARWGASIWLPGGVLYGLYFVWRVSYYGYLFPNPVYAKGGVSSAIISHPLLAISSLFPLLVVSLFAWERVFPNEFTSERSRRLAAGVIAGVSVVAIFTAAWFSPDTVATYFASDGKIGSSTKAIVSLARIGAALTGLIGLVLSAAFWKNSVPGFIHPVPAAEHQDRSEFYLFTLIGGIFVISALVSPIMMYAIRLFVPIVGLLAVLAICGLRELRLNRSTWSKAALIIVVILLVNPIGVGALPAQSSDNAQIQNGNFNSPIYSVSTQAEFGRAYGESIRDGPVQIGKWLNQRTTNSEKIAVPHAGAMPYYCKCQVIELGYLNNLNATHGTLTPSGVLSQEPKYIVLKFSDEGNVLGQPINRELYRNSTFQAEYEPVKEVHYVKEGFVEYRGERVDGPYRIYERKASD